MKRTVVIGAAVFVIGGLAACSSSSSSSSSSSPTASAAAQSLAQICPQVDTALTADLEGIKGTPTAEQLNKAEADLNAINAKASSEAQALIAPMAAALKAMAANPAEATETSASFKAFGESATAFKNACAAAGAPLSSPSAQPSSS